MTRSRAAVAIVVLSGLLARCASQSQVPRLEPSPQPVASVVRPLAEPGPEFSEWLPLPAQNGGRIGRDTGLRAAWYRCNVKGAGRLEVALTSPSRDLSYEVFDDSVVLASRKEHPLMLARGETRSGAGNSVFDVHGGVYYIHVATGAPLSTDQFLLTVTFTKQTPLIVETQPIPVPPPIVVPTPLPPPPSPAPAPSVVESLADGTRDNAVPLTTSATFNLSVGQGNGYRTRWAKYKVTQPSYYALCVTLTGAPVTVNTYRDATLLHSTTLGSSDGIVGTLPASTLWFQVQSPGGGRSDAAVHLIVHPKSSDSGFIKRGSQANPCGR